MNIYEANNNFRENKTITVRGRAKRLRILSKKLAFFNLEDTGFSIQIGVRSGILPKTFDIVECSGLMGFSQTREKTIWCDNPIVLSTCEGDLPNFKGISDGKLKTEKRFLDILTNPELKQNLLLRSHYIRRLREYFQNQSFIELETPILSSIPSGATAEPFVTKINATNETSYLRIATEINLKKAIVAGFENVFEIGKIFRNEGIDKTHNPEFTSIELYQSYGKLSDMKNHIVGLFDYLGVNLDFQVFEYDDVVNKYGENFDKELQKPTFVYGQPLEQTPLCAARPDGRADRFEFFMNGMEIANAYQELTDWKEQEKRLAGKNDDGLIEALRYGCPPLAGMGIGIDRLIMVLAGAKDIADVLMFPSKRN